jgi:hypothetical protein
VAPTPASSLSRALPPAVSPPHLTCCDPLDPSLRGLQVAMRELFGLHRLRAGGEVSKVVEMADIHELHSRPLFRPTWIEYSAQDAKVGA